MPETYPATVSSVMPLLLPMVRSLHAEALAKSPTLIDRTVQEFLREVGRQLTEELCAEVAQAAVAQARAVGAEQGKKLVVERAPKIQFTCLFGTITVVSPYLREAGTRPPPPPPTAPFCTDEHLHGVRPVNTALGVRGGGRTVSLTRVLTDFGLDSSFEVAAAKVQEHYGLRIHRTTIRRATLRQGERAEEEARLEVLRPFASGPPGPPLLVQMDGSCVRTGALVLAETTERTPKRQLPKRVRVTTWRDLRLAFVRRLDGDDAIFVGGILPLDEIARRLRGEAITLGWTPSTPTIRITDGGHGIREALDRVFPTGVHILDRPHLHHQLFETAQAMGLTDEEAKVATLRRSRQLAAGNLEAVTQELAEHRGLGQDRVSQFVGYLQRFGDAVAYDAFEKAGYPTGSGEIESAHKGHVQARLKLPGTWWTERNANALLALRLRRANGRWDDHWRHAA